MTFGAPVDHRRHVFDSGLAQVSSEEVLDMGSMGSETNPCELFGLDCDSEILAQVSSEALDGAFVFGENNPCELLGSDFPGCDREISLA